MFKKILTIFQKKISIEEVTSQLLPELEPEIEELKNKFNGDNSKENVYIINYSGAITPASVLYVATRGCNIAKRDLTDYEVSILCVEVFGHSELAIKAINSALTKAVVSSKEEMIAAVEAANNKSDFLVGAAIRANQCVAKMFESC